MLYHSTRGDSMEMSFLQVLLAGLAPDGGLYVPKHYPQLSGKQLHTFRRCGYRTVAHEVLWLFAGGMPWSDLNTMLRETYTPGVFGTNEITPLKWLEPGRLALLQLSGGPTLAFKDVPLQLLGRLMDYALEKKGGTLNVLGATSGDTGSAAAYALAGRSRLKLFMLSPYGRMSRFQQLQMYTLYEPNIFNLVVNGTFDDCQDVVKAVNADADFKKKYNLGAMNSINWARIAAQVVYYVYGYCKATENIGDEVSFSVPSGNFGNALAAHVARQMGVPIRDIIVATNENDVLDRFFRTGEYRPRKGSDVKITSSPSMDIASASNFERWVYDLTGSDQAETVRLLSLLKSDGGFVLPKSDRDVRWMRSGKATNAEVLETIRMVHQKYNTIIDPHTAVGVKVGLEWRGDIPLIVAETAQPAKFADTIREALGFEPPIPEKYKDLEKLPEHMTRIDPDAETVKRFIAAHA